MEQLAQHLVAGVPKGAFGGWVPLGDAAVDGDDNDAVERVIDNVALNRGRGCVARPPSASVRGGVISG
jgi:hypothetical protein